MIQRRKAQILPKGHLTKASPLFAQAGRRRAFSTSSASSSVSKA